MTDTSERTGMAATTKITRKQLVDAVEAGIAEAEDRPGFTRDVATSLRNVALTAPFVARCGYYRHLRDGTIVGCPVSQAFPDYAYLTWDTAFACGFDTATNEMTPPGVGILEVAEPAGS